VHLGPLEVDAIAQGTHDVSRRVDDRAPHRVDVAVGSERVALGAAETATVALAPVEIDALVRGAEALTAPVDPDTMRTVETVRIARGTAPNRPETAHPRGPRRARETLRADSLKSPGKPSPPSRKR
jgi:hypothetical protein